jgi:hypothetical protein
MKWWCLQLQINNCFYLVGGDLQFVGNFGDVGLHVLKGSLKNWCNIF